MNTLEKIEAFINDRRLEYPQCRIAIGKEKDFWRVELYDECLDAWPVNSAWRLTLDAAIEELITSI